jgi:hypothetical protein
MIMITSVSLLLIGAAYAGFRLHVYHRRRKFYRRLSEVIGSRDQE